MHESATDSPVFAWFRRDEVSGRLVQHHERTAELAVELELRRVVQAAIRSSAMGRIQDALNDVETSDVRDAVRAGLRLELAVAAANENEYDVAIAAFDGSEPSAESPLRATWLQQYGLTLSRRGRAAVEAEDDPSPDWKRAERLLTEAREELGDSEETCGILGGLVKGRCHWELERGQTVEARASLRRMTALYQAGFDAEPSYYAGVNLVAGLRLSVQRLGATEWTVEHLRNMITVVRFFAERACAGDADGFWPLVTLAELDLHAHLLTGSPGVDAAAARYADAAAVTAPRAWRQSAAHQLDLLMRLGDPTTWFSRSCTCSSPTKPDTKPVRADCVVSCNHFGGQNNASSGSRPAP